MRRVSRVIIDQEVARADSLNCSYAADDIEDAVRERECLHYEVSSVGERL